MHTRSKLFEAGYAEFLADVFAQDISSVSTAETATHRTLIFAGYHRTAACKSTGLLRSECLDRETGEWLPRSSRYLPAFWAKDVDVLHELRYAWSQRLLSYLPPAKVCFNELTKVQSARGDTAKSLQEMFVRMAADRRLATPAVRAAAKRCVVAGMWNYLVDRGTLKLCFAIFGRKAGMVEYNYTVLHREALQARERETPNLTPLIGAYLRTVDAKLVGKVPPPQNVVALAKTHLFSAATAETRPWAAFPPLTPQGWRYLATLSRTAIENLWRAASEPFYGGDEWPGGQLSRALNMLAKTDTAPPLTFIQWWTRALNRLEADTPAGVDVSRNCEGLQRFLRLAASQAVTAGKRGQLKRFVTGDLALAWDWFRGDETPRHRTHLGNIRGLEKNMTWPAVMRAQHEWHALAAEREAARRAADRAAYARYLAELDARSWDSLVGKCRIEGVDIRPLTSGKALRTEGRQMTHCVGGVGYIEACTTGSTRIFSMRDADERVTVELFLERGSTWKVGQVFRKENVLSSKHMHAVAAALAKAYSQAARAASAPANTKQ